MGMKLLFVCTGNTCRSPMAEGLAREMFGASVQLASAGLAALGGEKASPYALDALREQNIDISSHRSQRVSGELIAEADWVIPMTQKQEEALKALFPQAEGKIRYLGDWGDNKGDISDPWSGSLATYRQTAREIGQMLKVLKDQLPLA